MDNVIQVQFRKETFNLPGDLYEDDLDEELVNKLELYALNPPQNRQEYLAVVKDMLTEDDYRDILCGIMDFDIFNTIEPKLQEFVEIYFKMDS